MEVADHEVVTFSESSEVVPKLPIPKGRATEVENSPNLLRRIGPLSLDVAQRNKPVEEPPELDTFFIPGIQETLYTNEQVICLVT